MFSAKDLNNVERISVVFYYEGAGGGGEGASNNKKKMPMLSRSTFESLKLEILLGESDIATDDWKTFVVRTCLALHGIVPQIKTPKQKAAETKNDEAGDNVQKQNNAGAQQQQEAFVSRILSVLNEKIILDGATHTKTLQVNVCITDFSDALTLAEWIGGVDKLQSLVYDKKNTTVWVSHNFNSGDPYRFMEAGEEEEQAGGKGKKAGGGGGVASSAKSILNFLGSVAQAATVKKTNT